MALILQHNFTPQDIEDVARISYQLRLSECAQIIAHQLDAAWRLNGDAPGHIDTARLRTLAERAVTSTQPSRPEAATTAAKLAHRQTLAEVLEDTANNPKYADHSSADLIRRALTEFANTLDRLGVAYILAAHDGSLEARR